MCSQLMIGHNRETLRAIFVFEVIIVDMSNPTMFYPNIWQSQCRLVKFIS